MRIRLWNYNGDNSDQGGDDWNGENFSWFSNRRTLPASLLDTQQTTPTLDNGGRILRAIVRPYPAKTAGIPLRFSYETNTGEFTYEWTVPGADDTRGSASVNDPPRTSHPALTSRTTEIFVPSFTAHGSKVIVNGLEDADEYHYDETCQTLFITTAKHVPGKVYRIEVSLSPRLRRVFEVNDFWSDWGHVVGGAGVALLAAYVLLLKMWFGV